MRLRFHRLREDERPKRIKKFVFTIVCVFVWTGPYLALADDFIIVLFKFRIKVSPANGQSDWT